MEHQDIANTLWAGFTIILSMVCILGGSDLSGAISNVVTFGADRNAPPGAPPSDCRTQTRFTWTWRLYACP